MNANSGANNPSTSHVPLTALADFHQLDNPAYVNDIVIHRNACEQRKLQKELRVIEKMKETKRKSIEQEKHYFATMHNLVTDVVKNRGSRKRYLERERLMEEAKESELATDIDAKYRPPLLKGMSLPQISTNQKCNQVHFGLKRNKEDLKRKREYFGSRVISPYMSKSFPGDVRHDRAKTAQWPLVRPTAPVLPFGLARPNEEARPDQVARPMEQARPIELVRRKPRISVTEYGKNGRKKLRKESILPPKCRLQDLCLRRGSQTDHNHLEVSMKIDGKTLNTARPLDHEKQSLGVVKCDDGRILLGTRLPELTPTSSPLQHNPEAGDNYNFSDLARVLEKSEQDSRDEFEERSGFIEKTMVKFLPRTKQASFMRKISLNMPDRTVRTARHRKMTIG